jgi:hypothetical protein
MNASPTTTITVHDQKAARIATLVSPSPDISAPLMHETILADAGTRGSALDNRVVVRNLPRGAIALGT